MINFVKLDKSIPGTEVWHSLVSSCTVLFKEDFMSWNRKRTQ